MSRWFAIILFGILMISCSNMIEDYLNINEEPNERIYSDETYVDLTGPLETGVFSVVTDFNHMFIGGSGPNPYIYKISIATNDIIYAPIAQRVYKSVMAGDYIWSVGGGSIQKINKYTLTVVWHDDSTIDDARSITFDGTYIWCADRGNSRMLHRIHANNHTINSYAGIVAEGARNMCFDGTYLWLTCEPANEVIRINASDVTHTIISSNNAWGISYNGTYIIVAGADGRISKIDPATATEIAVPCKVVCPFFLVN